MHSKDVLQSLLLGLTLAMSAVPEEIPVAFSAFMALGAAKMAKLGIITRQPQTIENLGAVSVICLDKTGPSPKIKCRLKGSVVSNRAFSGNLMKIKLRNLPCAYGGQTGM